MSREERLFDAIGGVDESLLKRSERKRGRVTRLEWAVGLAEELPWPTGICDVAETVQAIQKFADLDVLVRAASPRPYPEILDAADLIYRLDWACVDARVMGMPAPAGVEPGVVSERHHALFWLAGCDGRCGWDEVNLST